MAGGVGTKDDHEKLYRFIDGLGGPLGYIDAEAEAKVFQRATELGLWKGQAEALLNHRCKVHRWTRQTEIGFYLQVILGESVRRDGALSHAEFDRAVSVAEGLRMPRDQAVRSCLELVKAERLKIRPEGWLFPRDWLKQYPEAEGLLTATEE